MLVEIFSDTVCPWCFVGKRRFELALAERPHLDVDVRLLPYELNPDLPPEGMDRAAYMRMKFGDVNRFAAAQGELTRLGGELAIDFRFDLIARTPNTRRSHALLAFASARGLGAACNEAVLRAYFTEGRDIAALDELADIAHSVGLPRADAHAACDAPELHAQIEALESRARNAGITGVPAFVFERKYLVSGAQDAATFVRILDAVAAESPGAAS